MLKTVRLSGIAYESLVNGAGIRRVFFAQGCKHNCKGCFNPDTHSFEGGEDKDLNELITSVLENPILRGVTFSGGDPWEQADKFAYLASNVRKHNLTVWCYTGYTFEYILEHKNDFIGWSDLLYNIDVLIDGEFEESLAEDGLRFRGSTNQRIIDIKESLKSNSVVQLGV